MSEDGAGYSIHQDVFDRLLMCDVVHALALAKIPHSRAGARHVLAVPAVRALSSAPQLLSIAAAYVGPSAAPFRATLFDKSLASNWLVPWHQDTALPIQRQMPVDGWGPWTHKGGVLHAIAPAAALATVVALRVHLDDSTSRNGPLRLLPGTHLDGVLGSAALDRFVESIQPVECTTESGGVVAMRPLTVHASSKAVGERPRRVLHIEYAATSRFDEGVELAIG
jgi:hypothetical protein